MASDRNRYENTWSTRFVDRLGDDDLRSVGVFRTAYGCNRSDTTIARFAATDKNSGARIVRRGEVGN